MANLPNVGKVGDTTFHGWSGRLSKPQRKVDVYYRIGQTGSGAQSTGKRGKVAVINVWTCKATKLDAEAFADALDQLSGTIQRVTDGFDQTFERVRITDVSSTKKCGKGPDIAGGVASTYLVRTTFEMEVLP